MQFKKWHLSLGSLLVASAPVASVIACSSTPYLDKISEPLFKELTSDPAEKDLWWQWLTNVIKTFDNENYKNLDFDKPWENATIKKLIKFYLSDQLRKDPLYIQKLANKLLNITKDNKPVYNTDQDNEFDLDLIGMFENFSNGYNEDFFNSKIEKLGKDFGTRIDLFSKILMTERGIGFANDIYKHVVTSEFLAMSLEEYKEFRLKQDEKEYYITPSEELIQKNKNFLLIKKLLEKRLFFTWEIKEKQANNYFLEKNNEKIVDALKQFIKSANEEPTEETIADGSNHKTKNSKLDKGTWDWGQVITINVDGVDLKVEIKPYNYVGFKGISVQEKGKGKLDLSIEHLKKSTIDYWIGIIQGKKDAKDLITSGIDFNDPDSEDKKARLELGIGIMPVWDQDKNHLSFEKSLYKNNFESIAWIIYSMNEDLFKEVETYFAEETNKGGKGIKIKIGSQKVLDHWKSKNIKFVEKS